jgi:site-specific recombinase XerC
VLPAHPELDALWVSELGTQLNIGILTNRIVVRTKAAFGRSISPHLFRDCAATSIAGQSEADRRCFPRSRARRARDDRKAL